MTEETDLQSSALNLPRCPYLGSIKDKNVFVNSPSRVNFCHKSLPGVFPSFTLQKKICLSPVFTQCPVFNKPEKGKIPDDLRWKGPLSLESGVLGWVTVPFLAVGFAILVLIVGVQNNWWRELPMTGIIPAAGETLSPATQTAASSKLPAVLPIGEASGTGTASATAVFTLTPTDIPFFQRLFPPPSTNTPTQNSPGSPAWPFTPTLTFTFTPTRTLTRTATPPGTATPTRTSTRTAMPTRTATPIGSFTLEPTLTFTPTFTFTPTVTNTLEPTATESQQPTGTEIQKPTPTPKPTYTPHPTKTPKPTHPPGETSDAVQPSQDVEPTGDCPDHS